MESRIGRSGLFLHFWSRKRICYGKSFLRGWSLAAANHAPCRSASSGGSHVAHLCLSFFGRRKRTGFAATQGADAAIAHFHHPCAEEICAHLDLVGPETSVHRRSSFQPDTWRCQHRTLARHRTERHSLTRRRTSLPASLHRFDAGSLRSGFYAIHTPASNPVHRMQSHAGDTKR